MKGFPHSCSTDPEGCTEVCDARAEAEYEHSPEGRRRGAAIKRVEARHLTSIGQLTPAETRARLREYDEEEAR